MNGPDMDRLLQQIVESASSKISHEREPLLIEDEDLLLRWVEGDLSEEEHKAIIEHLAQCDASRREIAAMVKAGALVLPEVEPVSLASSNADRINSRQWTWAALAVAASLLLMVWMWGSSAGEEEALLAQLQQQLDAGGALTVFDEVEAILDGQVEAGTNQQAQRLLEESGYQAARASLTNGNFQQVLELEQRVANKTEPSARLLNLRFQAKRGLPAEQSLDKYVALNDQFFGYELSGRSFIKGGPTQLPTDDEQQRLEQSMRQAIEQHPDDVTLLLNYGHYLLGQRNFEDARQQLERALAVDELNVQAQLALGLLRFQEQDFEEALDRFQAAARLATDSFAAQLNTAICLNRMNRSSEAAPYFQRAAELTTDPELREKLLEMASAGE